MNTAIAGRTDLAFDGTTLTYTGDGMSMADLVIDLDAIDDTLVEGDEDYTVSITMPGSTTGSDVVTGAATSVTTTITDNDTAIWSITGDATVDEGATAQYTLALNGTLQTDETATIDLSIADVDTTSADYANFVAAVNVAIAGRPDLTFDGTTLTYTGDGMSMANLIIDLDAIDDAFVEGDEDYAISISSPGSTTGGDVTIAMATSVTTTITDNDSANWNIIGNTSVVEGAASQYILSLVGATLQSGETATIDLGLMDVDTTSTDYANFVTAVNTAIAGRADLMFDGTKLTYAADGNPFANVFIDLDAIDDTLVESDEDYTVSIANPGSTTGSDIVTGGSTSVTTTITDNDVAIWSIAGDATVGEGSTAQYTVSLEGTLQSGETAVVDLGLVDVDTTSADYANFVAAVDNAIAGRTDLTFDGVTLTYTGDGMSMADLVIDLDAIDDTLVEGGEDYTVSISRADSTTDSAVVLGGTTTVTTTIADNDLAIWSINGDATVDEGATAQYIVALNGTLQTDETATIDLGLTDVDTNSADYANFVAAVNTAIAGRTDLTFDGVTLTYTGDGMSMADLVIDLDAIDDTLVEGDEDYTISINNPGSTTGSDVAIGGPSLVTTTIIDNDMALWTIAGDPTVAESATAQYRVSFEGTLQSGETATVDLVLANVDTNSADYANFVAAVNAAVASRVDLSFDGTTLTHTGFGFPMLDLVINLDAIDDTLVEGDEDFTVSIVNPGSTTGSNVGLGATTTVTTTIVDDDVASWSLAGDATVGEGATAQYTVALTGILQTNETATIDLGIADVDTTSADYDSFVMAVNAAIAGRSDLTFDGMTLTYTGDGMPMADLIIDLMSIDDVLVEGDEDYTVSITGPGSTTGSDIVTAGTTAVTTTIIDNDMAIWSINGDATVGEGSTAQYTVELDGTLQAGETATIELGLDDVDTSSIDYANFVAAVNTAIAGRSDLAFDGTTLTYTGDGMPMVDLVIDLMAIDDVLVEGNEDYTLFIANPGSTTGGNIVTGGTTAVTTTITDNDIATWSLVGDATVGEGATAQYTVSLDGTLQANETATIELSIADVDTNSTDYANFVAAVNTAVATRSDLAFDGTTLTYTGDGVPMVDLIIDLTAIDDSLIESDEDYTVSIANPSSTTGSAVVGGPTTVTTTITDNDLAIWNLAGDATVAEGATAQYTVSLTGTLQANETATIELGIANVDTTSADYDNFVATVNTAVAGRTDLAFDGTTLTYTGDGLPMAELIIDLDAIDDTQIEGVESYTVSLSNPGATTDIVLGTNSVTTTIGDNDIATWSLSGDTSVNEGATAQYTVALSGTLQTGETATVNLGIADVDTTSADYTNFVMAVDAAVSMRSDLTFDGTTLTYTGDGMPMADLIIDLPIVDDTLAEGTESYSVDIANPGSTSGGTVAGTGLITTMIQDNDSLLWNINGSSNVDEGGIASYKVALDGELQIGEQASVRLTLANLETSSTDYSNFISAVQMAVAARPDLSFDMATGILTVTGSGGPMADLCIELTAIDDSFIEGPERFQVMLADASSATGLVTGINPTESLVTTTINYTVGNGGVAEKGVWSLGVDQTVPEGTAGAYTLSLIGNFQADEIVSVDLGLSDIDTMATDYASFNAAMIAAAAAYSGSGNVAWNRTTLTFTSDGSGPMSPLAISLNTTNDSIAEGTEDFLISLSNAVSMTGAGICIDAANDGAVTTIDDTSGSDGDDVTWNLIGDTTVDEGGSASYLIGISGAFGAGQSTSVDLALVDIDTNGSDYASFNAAVTAAVMTYNSSGNPGTLVWDGNSLTFAATNDGDTFAGIMVDLLAEDDALLEGPEQYRVSLSNAGSASGIVAGIDAAANVVVTTINDTDGNGGPPEPGGEWSLTGTAAVTEGDPIQYTIGLTGNLQSGEAVSVQVTPSDIETDSSDYASFGAAVNAAVMAYNGNMLNSGSLVWDGNFLTFTSDGSGLMDDLEITLSTVDDTSVEGDERLNVLLANPSSSTGLSPSISATQSVATTTIIDNDTGQWTITGDNSVGEGNLAEYTVSLSGTLQTGQTATIDLGIADVDTASADHANFAAAVNAAIMSRPDLAFDGTTLTFTSNGSPMANLSINLEAIDDLLIEDDEDYTVSIFNPGSTTGSGIGVGGSTTVVTTIIDNDAATWSIGGDATVGEGGVAEYTVSLDGTLQTGQTATIDLGLGDVDTTSADYSNFVAAINDAIATRSDLAFNGITLTYTGDGNPMADLIFELDAIDDSLIESDQDYTVSIGNPGSTTGGDIATAGTTVVTTTIADNDIATWSISGDSNVAEGLIAQYTVSLDGTLQNGETATIDIGIADIDTNSTDYANFVAAVNASIAGRSDLAFDGTTLTYTSDGNPMADLIIDLLATDDSLVESVEDYTVSISTPGSTTGVATQTDSNTTVTTTIADNDTANWSIVGDTTVGEGAIAVYTVSLDGTLQTGEVATIDLSFANLDTDSADYASVLAAVNSAVNSRSDLTFVGTTLTYTGDGNPMADLIIELGTVDDVLVEGDESYTITISMPGSTTGINVATAGPTTVTTTITDNDSAVWSISGDAQVDEGNSARYTLMLDGLLQADETATIDLELSDVDTTSTDYANFVAAVNAAVAGRADLSFDGTALTYTSDGTTMMPLIFDVMSIDDSIVESDEDFVVSISNPGSTTGSDIVAGGTTTVTTTIADNDTAIWSITGDAIVNEGDNAQYSIELSGLLQTDETATVELSVSNIDTISTDYGNFVAAVNAAVSAYSGPGSLMFDGTTLTFTSDGTGPMAPLGISVATINDGFAEGTEDFQVSLANSGSSTGAASDIDVMAAAVVTTIDDTTGTGFDGVTWSIAGDGSVDEGGTASYTVSLAGGLGAGNNASVDLSLMDIDTDSSDYANFSAAVAIAVANYNNGGSNPGALVWDGTTLTFTASADGESLIGLVIDLNAIDDVLLEGPEDYSIVLSNADSSTGIVSNIGPGGDTVVTTINDTQGDGGLAEAGPTWSLSGTTTVNEGDPIVLEVNLSGNLQAGVSASVELSIGDIDTDGSDYSNFNTAVMNAVAAYNADPANAGSLSWDGTELTFTSDGTGPMDTLEISTTAIDDQLVENDQSLSVTISGASSSTGLTPAISTTENEVVTTIIDNDEAQWSISGPATTSEGNSANYVVSLDGQFQAGAVATVQIDISDIDTTSSDYGNFASAVAAAAAANPDVTFDAATGTLTYTAPSDGATMSDLIVALPINSDGISEAPEDFVVSLSNAGGSTGQTPTIDPAAAEVTSTINGSPVTSPDDYFTSINTPLSGNVLANDSDPESDVLTVTHVDGQPIGGPIATDCGTVVMNSDGSFIFTPNPGMSGIDTFEYTVVDSAGNVETETVTIVINEAQIGVAKAARVPVANGENWDVTFTLVVENLGNVALNNLVLIDDLMTNLGETFIGSTPPVISNFSGTGIPPAINGSWSSNTALNILVGGQLDVGDSFEVVFTVTVDPDASGTATELENQAVAMGQGINPDGTIMTDGNGDPIIAQDISDNGSDPAGENGEDNMDGVFGNDPTQILIADLGLAKSVVGTPALLSNGNYELTYQLVVENTGTVNVAGLSLIENLASQFGTGFVDASDPIFVVPPTGSLSSITLNSSFNGAGATDLVVGSASLLEVGDSFTVVFTVEIDLAGIASPNVSNSVVGSGTAADENGNPINGPDGNPITANDLSDSGTDPSSSNSGEPGDTFGSDDATPLVIPSIGLAKQAGDPVANGPNWDVTFTLLFENNGTVGLTNLTLFDNIASEFGDAFVSVGNVSIQNYLGSNFGPTVNNGWTENTALSLISGGQLDPGESFEVVFTVTVDPDAGGTSSTLQNRATAFGEAIDSDGNLIVDTSGNPVLATDDSDNGTDPNNENDGENVVDGVFANDPTPLQIADLAIAKSVVGEPVFTWRGNAILTYQVVVENTGTVNLTNLSLIEDLQNQFGSVFLDAGNLQLINGPGNAASSIALNSSGWDGSAIVELLDRSAANLLAVGDSFTIEFTSTILAQNLTGPIENQVVGAALGVDANGNQLVDRSGALLTTIDESDNGIDPNGENGNDNGDGIFGNDPTPVDIEIDPAGFFYDATTGQILTGGSVAVSGPSAGSVNLVDAGADGSYQFFGTEPGRYVIAVTAPAGYVLDTDALAGVAFDPTGLGNPVLLGNNDADGNGVLDSSIVTQYFLEFDLEESDPAVFLNNLPFLREGTSGQPGGGSGGFGGFGGGPSGRPFLNVGGPGSGYSSSSFLGGTAANPLSLSSGYSGAGGYSGEGMGLFGFEDACCDPSATIEMEAEPIMVDPTCPCVVAAASDETIVAEHVTDDDADQENSGLNVLSEEAHADDVPAIDEASNPEPDGDDEHHAAESQAQEQAKPNDRLLKKSPSFLKRFHSWLIPMHNVES